MWYLTMNFPPFPISTKEQPPPNWANLVRHSSEKTTSDFFNLTKTWFQSQSNEAASKIIISQNKGFVMENTTISNKGAAPSYYESSPHIISPKPATWSNKGDPAITQDHKGELGMSMPKMIDLETARFCRSPCLQEKQSHLMSFVTILSTFCTIGIILTTYLQPSIAISSRQRAVNGFIHQCNAVNANFDETLNSIPHMIFMAGKENNECNIFKVMLSQPDKREFLEAMLKETNEHESRGYWLVVPRSSMPKGMKPIQAIWSFKHKRFLDGTLNKYKARLCTHGGMQQWGINYWETYAPVVNWISVCFLLIISEMLGLETQAIDFILAFPQATLDEPMYMYIPAGMMFSRIPDGAHHMHILKLEKFLYGLK